MPPQLEDYHLWTLTAVPGNEWLGASYDLTFTSQNCEPDACDESAKPIRWAGHLARIGQNTFLDLNPKDDTPDTLHWVPAHTFYRITITGNSMRLDFMSDEWLDRVTTARLVRIAHHHLGSAQAGGILVIDTTTVIRKLLLDFGSDPEAFPPENELVFRRSTSS